MKPKSRGPLQVLGKDNQLIGHLYQNIKTGLWVAYNKQPESVWRKFGWATREACVAWLRKQGEV